MPHVIYALVDPRDQRVCYIGTTQDVYDRFVQHIRCDGSNYRKDAWIRELKAANRVVIMTTLEIVASIVEAQAREAYWIYHYLHLGATLYNNHVPKPLHLQSKRAQALTLKGMRDAEAEAITMAVSKNNAVRELLAQGYGKVFIIEKVWHAKAGATQRYKQACAEYEQIISEVEEA